MPPLWLEFFTEVEDTSLGTNNSFGEFLYTKNYKYFLSRELLATL